MDWTLFVLLFTYSSLGFAYVVWECSAIKEINAASKRRSKASLKFATALRKASEDMESLCSEFKLMSEARKDLCDAESVVLQKWYEYLIAPDGNNYLEKEASREAWSNYWDANDNLNERRLAQQELEARL
jgi:hypothetical protein